MSPSPPLILVVGMHRSGTSLLGSMLPHLGVPLPGPLIDADQHNPEGYFERHDVTALQEQLLIDLGHWWPSQQGVSPLPADWMDHPVTHRCKGALRRLLEREQGQQTTAWAIKDPRTSLLLPLWLRLSQELNLPMRLVLSLREPSEVMMSLLQRDRIAAGMSAWRAQQLWWRHNLQVLLDAAQADLPLHVVRYERWFDQRARTQLEGLQHFCHGESNNPEALDAALACIKPQHRRSHRALQGWKRRMLHPRLARLQQQVEQISHGQRPARQLLPWLQRQSLPLTLPLSRLRGRQPGLTLAQLPQPQAVPSLPPGPLLLLGSNWRDWQAHAWLQHIPTDVANQTPELLDQPPHPLRPLPILHLQPVSSNPEEHRLLRASPAVYDPDPERCRQLRCMGVKAHWLQGRQQASNSWLRQVDLTAAASELGLPPLAALAQTPGALLCLSSGGHLWDQRLKGAMWCLPGFDQLQIETISQAQVLAAWLNHSQQLGLTLVRLQAKPEECERRGFRALSPPSPAPIDWTPPQAFNGEISPEELQTELQWQREGYPAPPPCPTPAPEAVQIWHHLDQSTPTAAVCISLYNYAAHIEGALESAWHQTHQALELIVVDDASSDDSLEQTKQWLQRRGQRFCKATLLQHRHNGGLAAARNTAFRTAEAPWCFVLDADNLLLPDAVASCLAIANAAPSSTAVVHPLVALEYVSPSTMPRSFISTLSWQRQNFLNGNVVDAMALVRRSAWEQVGGYTHIPGGWEDFDFWCQLIEAGLHGVLCPQRLAIYHSHDQSMAATGTRLQERQLSRLLQQRHPWLHLPKGRVGEDPWL